MIRLELQSTLLQRAQAEGLIPRTGNKIKDMDGAGRVYFAFFRCKSTL